MKKATAILVVLCLFVSVFSVTAFAADEGTSSTAGLTDLLGNLTATDTDPGFYVKANKDAGLDSRVDVMFDATENLGTLYLPGSADASQLTLCWKDKNQTVSRKGKTYASGKAPVAAAGKTFLYTVKNGSGSSAITVRTVVGSKDVKSMFLVLDESKGTIAAMNADDEHDTACYGKVKYDGANRFVSIKGRGNSTWSGFLGTWKKPYNFTLYDDGTYNNTKKAELIDGVKAKKWSLLANFADNSLMRNKIAMDLADNLGIGLKAEYVDVWMNGSYLGNYTMTPKKDYNSPDGGYALENDNYVEEEDQFSIPGMFEIGSVPGVSILGSGYHNRISIVDIGKDAKKAGVTNKSVEKYFLQAWDALEDYDSEAYQNYFDLDSWAKMFLMYEVSKTYDCYAGSLMMHRDGLTKNDKLQAGPAWDYDVTFGRTLHKFFVGVSEPVQVNAEGWYNDAIGLMAVDEPVSLLQELGRHASFMKHVSKVYTQYKWAFEDLSANVNRQRPVLKDSALMNNVLYGTHSLCAEYVIAPNTMRAIGTGKYKLNYKVTTTWDDYIDNLGEYCDKRVMWLSDHLAPGVDIVTAHGGVVKN